MKAFLDDRALTDAPSPGAALDSARALAQKAGRVIIEVKLDGRALTDDEVDAPSSLTGERLECVTADPCELVRQSIEQAADALDEARSVQADTAGALQAGDMAAAFEMLGEVVSVWESVKQVLEQGPALIGVAPARLAPVSPNGQVEDIEARMTALSTTLHDLKRALQAQDWSTVADLLQVEMDEQAGAWVEMLRKMAERVATA